MNIVRDNLMNIPGYSPYCGDPDCAFRMPRTVYDGEQFKCKCGWRSEFPDDFMAKFRAQWDLSAPNSGGAA